MGESSKNRITHECVESQESGLDPGPLPVESPLDSGEEYECLKRMLNEDAGPIILDPAFADCFCEWHANPGAQNEHGIANGQCSRVF